MITFTIQHTQGESCDYVLKGLTKAHSDFWSGKAAEQFKAKYGIAGRLRALEVTYGENGWHAHIHALLFIKAKDFLFIDAMQERVAQRWQRVLSRHDHYASLAHGVHIRSGDDFIAEYIAKFNHPPKTKWTEAHEVAHAHRKKARDEGLTPMALLRLAAYGDDNAKSLWKEYALAFKGKRQLDPSKGLWEMLGLGREKSDEEVNLEQSEMAIILARLDKRQWAVVLGNDIRGELLEAAGHGQMAVKAFLESWGIYGAEYPGLYDSPTVESVMDVIFEREQ